jgi:rod shape determining protein RodA
LPWAQLRADTMMHPRTARDNFSSMLAIGIGSLIFVEFTINVAMVLGIFPVVGTPLPFFSCDGSSMVTICVCLGLLITIDRDSMRQQNRA